MKIEIWYNVVSTPTQKMYDKRITFNNIHDDV
jgi:hypothetical protein